MQRPIQISNWMVDAGGAAVVASCALLFLWLSVLRHHSPANELMELKQCVGELEQDFAKIKKFVGTKRARLSELESELAAKGRPPQRLPLEDYFRTMAELSARNQLSVVELTPFGMQEYHSVKEHRFTYKVLGRFPDLMSFLYALEQSDHWADVSYLSVAGPSRGIQSTDFPTASLTISMFSADKTQGDKVPRNE